MGNRFSKALLALTCAIVAAPPLAQAQRSPAVSIATPNCERRPANSVAPPVAAELRARFEEGGLSVLRRYPAGDTLDLDLTPRFQQWRSFGASHVLICRVETSPGGQVVISFRLYDLINERHLDAHRITTPADAWLEATRSVSDRILRGLRPGPPAKAPI